MQKIILTFTAIVSLFMMSCNSNSKTQNLKSEKENLTVAEASKLLSANALLIDVREPEELTEQSYDVKEVKNIPLGELENHLSEIPKDKQVILACQRGGRSQKAFDLLKSKGFTNISNLEGGMNAWSKAGLPIKTATVGKKACCANPDSENCNPDGTCKKTTDEKAKCCSDNNGKACGDNADRKMDGSGKCTEESKACCNKPANKSSTSSSSVKNHLELYAFHGARQCSTCKNMKANTQATLNKYFSDQIKNGTIVFSVVDVDDEKNKQIAEKFEASGTALMINNVVNGKDNITDWSVFAFEKANDEAKFIPELKSMIDAVLKKQNGSTASINR